MFKKRKEKYTLILIILFLISLIIGIYVKFFQDNGKQWIMPKELNEISGISFTDDNFIACVQDEKGSIYIYDLESSSIIDKIKFAGKGDYEGIAIVVDTAYVITGDGILYEIANFSDSSFVTSYTIHLSKNEESEAICYDKEHNRLLIAMKNRKKNKINPEFFAFDLAKKEFQYNPVLQVNLKEELFKRSNKNWEPADLAIDPENKKIFVVDAVNRNLLELSMTAELQKVTSLHQDLFPHPEGIAVRKDGSIFICNDGNKDGIGTIRQIMTN